MLPHNKQAHLLHKPIASLWPVRYSVSCHATQHTRPVEEGQGIEFNFYCIIKTMSQYSWQKKPLLLLFYHGREGGMGSCMQSGEWVIYGK